MASTDRDQQFIQLCDQEMADILDRLDEFDPDELEADLSMGVLRMTFADGRKCIMNRQTAAHQIWLAEGARAWHFSRDAARQCWVDTKGQGELRPILASILSTRLGRAVEL
jgi:CyaY protein